MQQADRAPQAERNGTADEASLRDSQRLALRELVQGEVGRERVRHCIAREPGLFGSSSAAANAEHVPVEDDVSKH